jgi:hypothetical protein
MTFALPGPPLGIHVSWREMFDHRPLFTFLYSFVLFVLA